MKLTTTLYSILSKLAEQLNRISLTTLSLSIFFVALLLFSFGQVSYNDFFWHLALGKWMIVNKQFLTHDIFSHTFNGVLWLNNTWIFDGALYLLFVNTGSWGLNALRFIVFGLTYYFLFKIIRLKSSIPTPIILAAFLLTIPLTRNFLRPEITAPLFTSFFLYALYSYKYRVNHLLFLLPIVELIWVNTHGGFTLGVILIAIFLGATLIREIFENSNNILKIFKSKELMVLSVILFVTIVATFINPYGTSIYQLIKEILVDRESLINIGEWQPVSWTSFLSLSLDSQLALILFGWLALGTLIIQSLKSAYNNTKTAIIKNLALEDIVIYLLLLFSALEYVRGLHLFALIAMLIFLKQYRYTKTESKSTMALIIFSTAFILMLFLQKNSFYFNREPAFANTIPESINFLTSQKPSGNILNEYGAGSELAWLLYPHYKLFIDGRTPNVYSGQFYWYYRNIMNENIFKKMIQDHSITIAVVQHGWDITPFLETQEWNLVFFDNYYAIYLSNDKTNKPLREERTYTILKPTLTDNELSEICKDDSKKKILRDEITRNMQEVKNPLPTFVVDAKLNISCESTHEDLKRAEDNMNIVIHHAPRGSEHYFHLGSLQLSLYNDKSAAQNFKKSTQLNKTKKNMTGLGIALYNLGQYKQAARTFHEALYAPGEFPKEYYQIYGRTNYQLDKNEAAIDLLHRYIDIIGEVNATSEDFRDISYAYTDAGDTSSAEFYMNKANEYENSIQ